MICFLFSTKQDTENQTGKNANQPNESNEQGLKEASGRRVYRSVNGGSQLYDLVLKSLTLPHNKRKAKSQAHLFFQRTNLGTLLFCLF